MRSRRLEEVGQRENGPAQGRHAPSPVACLLLSRAFFLVPTTSKRLQRRLGNSKRTSGNSLRLLRAQEEDIGPASHRLSDIDVNRYT